MPLIDSQIKTELEKRLSRNKSQTDLEPIELIMMDSGMLDYLFDRKSYELVYRFGPKQDNSIKYHAIIKQRSDDHGKIKLCSVKYLGEVK